MTTPIREFYLQQKSKIQARISILSKVNQRYVIGRLSLVISIIVFIAIFWRSNSYQPMALTILFGISLFLFLLKRHQKVTNGLQLQKQLLQINEHEQLALKGEVSQFKSGNNFLSADHHFARDLDILGERGLYQHICRTSTDYGDRALANLLLNPLNESEAIRSRQELLRDLSEEIDWRLNFRAKAQIAFAKVKELKGIESIPMFFSDKPLFKLVTLLSPIVFIVLVGLFLFGLLPQATIVIFLLAQLAFTARFLKRINKVHGVVGKRQHTLKLFATMFGEFESASFQNKQLKQLQNESEGACSAISELNKELNLLDSRLNMIMGIVLNATMLWDIRRLIRIEKWFKKHRIDFERWLSNISQFEAYESMANYCCNKESFVFAEISDASSEIIVAKELGHPLMSENTCVTNDFKLNAGGQIVLLSGANMSGKSTFLRTVGLNMVMAKMGLPVCARDLSIKSTSIFTSMRIDDDLNDGESFFYAELKRLQQLIQRLEKGEEVFFLLDEILRGTNSNDKHKGSEGLLKKLIGLKSSGILATHDIALSALEDEFPNRLLNKSFEVENKNGELMFDYKLRSGVCQNLNASYLMHKMGVIDG